MSIQRAGYVVFVWLLVAWPSDARSRDGFDAETVSAIKSEAGNLQRLHSLLVLHDGKAVIEYVRAGPSLDTPVNIKSLSKTLLAALAGIAIERGYIESVERPVVGLLERPVPAGADPRVSAITLGDVLSMRAGLASTSGRNYGAWVQSGDWVGHVLSRPFVDEPGGEMIYSTGSSHLVAAALVAATGRSVLELAREWLGGPLDIRFSDWMRDPQGIHFGGNQMQMSPRDLARFGEMVRAGGVWNGRRVLAEAWIRASWTRRVVSPWSNDDYGYGWFIAELGGETVYYGRGYGGQMLYVVPARALTVVVTSDSTPPSSGGRHFRALERFMGRVVIPAAQSR